MTPIILNKDNNNSEFLYEQLYKEMKGRIISGDIRAGERCPSIRALSESLGISVTTVLQAYGQLTAEGYIRNRPGSGYYAETLSGNPEYSGYVTGGAGRMQSVSEYGKYSMAASADELHEDSMAMWTAGTASADTLHASPTALVTTHATAEITHVTPEHMYDPDSFDFTKWKKCASKIYTDYSEALMYRSDIKGERALRREIAAYLLRSRGVHTSDDNIIIAAGTQQTVFHLSRILKRTGMTLISVESPGYTPVKSMFTDAGFTAVDIPVTDTGIGIEALPVNIRSAVYLSPSNQFPTGVVMPVGRRYEILDWATANNSYIIEDDYNSELRYFGRPLPTLKSLDVSDRVIYLGSFSSTLFPAVKISYMVLPDALTEIFDTTAGAYSQTCSKAEQLTLALYMSQGHYYTTIRKKRALFTRKLTATIDAFNKYAGDGITLINTASGLFITVKISPPADHALFTSRADSLRLSTALIEELSSSDDKYVQLYYSYIPLVDIENVVKNLLL